MASEKDRLRISGYKEKYPNITDLIDLFAAKDDLMTGLLDARDKIIQQYIQNSIDDGTFESKSEQILDYIEEEGLTRMERFRLSSYLNRARLQNN